MTLDQWRLSRGLTYADLVALLGFQFTGAHTTMIRYCQGAIVPRRGRMLAIIKATGGAVTANDFIMPEPVPAVSLKSRIVAERQRAA